MSSITTNAKKINTLLERLQMQKETAHNMDQSGGRAPPAQPHNPPSRPMNLGNFNTPRTPPQMRPNDLVIRQKPPDTSDIDRRFKEIMQSSGKLKINNVVYDTAIKDMEYLEDLGSGTCGHVVKMRHKPSGEVIAVKQMRRSVNSEENKRIVMDIEVVIKSHDCPFIVQCLGCFITDSEVWICMELMSTCFDKLLKRLQQPIPEQELGKVVVATVSALAYLKDKHGVIHRDVKPSNILVDEKGNVKLCDFGISGRLVDSRAKTRSAGCAAYMAPERIDLHNPDYDIRADVWSLGITLIELATGILPYQDCKTDFEVLTRVIQNEPPSLPADKDYSPQFRNFVSACLTKEKDNRPKYAQLKELPFMKKYENIEECMNNWFVEAIRQAEAVAASKSTPRHTPTPSQKRPQPPLPTLPTTKQPYQQLPPQPPQFTNGSTMSPAKLAYMGAPATGAPDKLGEVLPPDGRQNHHTSRLANFLMNSDGDKRGPRGYSPLQNYHNHIQAKNASNQDNKLSLRSPLYRRRDESLGGDSPCTSPLPQRKGDRLSSPFFQRKTMDQRSPMGSPLPLRAAMNEDGVQYPESSSSPIVLQRFYHQQKQQMQAKEAEENASGKKKFASYMQVHLSTDRSGRNSRHQSPEPPPRLNRGVSGDQSPLAIRRNYIENTTASPSLPRRYVSPTPPIPPPRRLSESTSVPGSPQHLRARFHYTPEPQRRLYQNEDVS